MAKKTAQDDLQNVPALVGDIVHESGRLVSQQIDLLRAEVGSEVSRLAAAGGAVAGGGALVAAAGAMSGLALAHLVRTATGLPMWLCYGLVAGGFGAAGAALVKQGRDEFAAAKLLPETAKAVGENVEWLRGQATPATA